MTSVALLELLFDEVWRARPNFIAGDAEIGDVSAPPLEVEARLVIGDAALLLRTNAGDRERYAYDLGEVWKKWTGLPFVFAVWVAQRSTAVTGALAAHASLLRSREWGLKNLDVLAEQAESATGIARTVCREYLSGLDYEAPVGATATAKRETEVVASTAAAQAKRVRGTAVGQTKVVARTANQDIRELADTVRDQTDQVKGELADQTRELLSETRDKFQAQADVQTDRLAAALSQVGTQAVALAGGRPDEAGPLTHYAEQAADWLDMAAAEIEERGIEGLAADVTDFARRRPGVFLAGAALVGLGVGRLVRSGAVSTDGTEGPTL